MAPFDIKELRDLTAYDELELDTLGEKKTALFVIISDTDEVLVQKDDVAAIEDLHNDALTIEMIPGASHGIRLDAGQVYDELVDRYLAVWMA